MDLGIFDIQLSKTMKLSPTSTKYYKYITTNYKAIQIEKIKWHSNKNQTVLSGVLEMMEC